MRKLVGGLFILVSLSACGGGSDDATVATPSQPDEAATVDASQVPREPIETTVRSSVDEGAVEVEPSSGDSRSITVGGMGAEYAPPDRCVVDLAVQAQRGSVNEASRAAAAAGQSLIAALTASGVDPSGIQTSHLWINPVHDQFEYRTVVGYEVAIGYRVAMPDVAEVGTVLGRAVEAGGDSVGASSVRFETDPTVLMDAARAEAWTDVQARAESTAEHAGEPLGRVLDVHEKVLVTSSQGMMQGGEGDSASFDIPVSPGVSGVTVLLTVTYEIGS